MKQISTILCLLISLGVAAQGHFTYKVNEEELLNRFLSYVTIESQSIDDPDMSSFPLSDGQKKMATRIYEECKQIAAGRSDIRVVLSPTFYVYVDIASNMKRNVPSLMLMAHLDSTPDAPGEMIKPMVHRNYDGGEIHLPAGITFSPALPQCTHLKELVGHTIVTSDGSTLISADDKTGCAIMVSVLEELVKNPKARHGRIVLTFSQNEDVGKAHLGFDKNILGTMPDIVVDIDGSTPNEFSVANFSAVGQSYYFKGNNVHPSEGKENHYADALSAAAWFIGKIPPDMHPSARGGEGGEKEGYIHAYTLIHPTDEQGHPITTDWVVKVRLRYFSQEEGMYQKQLMDDNLRRVQKVFPFVEATRTDNEVQYENVALTMPYFLPNLIEESARDAGVEWHPASIRGGTTGAMLVSVFPDMPGASCLYSGQQAEHSVYEYASVQEMLQIISITENIIFRIADMKGMPTASSAFTQSERKNHAILNTVRKKLPKGVD